MSKEWYFKINQSQNIELKNLSSKGGLISSFDEVEMKYVNHNTEYRIFEKDLLIILLDLFHYTLIEALNNKLEIDETRDSKQDQNYNFIEVVETKDKKIIKSWKGKGHALAIGEEFSAWMFNKNNKIFIEIIPSYIQRDSSVEASKFDTEFIKKFKPCVTIEIDNKTATNWLSQIENILSEIEKTDTRSSEQSID